MNQTPDKLIRTEEALKELGVGIATLYRLRAKGLIQWTKPQGLVYYSLNSINNYKLGITKGLNNGII